MDDAKHCFACKKLTFVENMITKTIGGLERTYCLDCGEIMEIKYMTNRRPKELAKE